MALCSRAEYRRITGDYDSYDGYVDSALADAQDHLQDETGRFFETGERTETLIVDSDGYVWPRALPITSVSSPTGATISGYKVYAGYYYNVDLLPFDRVAVTYVGGYAADAIPKNLERLVARIAFSNLRTDSETPKGATSVRVGDVSYSGKNLGQNIDATLESDIKKWAHPSTRLGGY